MAISVTGLVEKMLIAPAGAPSRSTTRLPLRQPESRLYFVFSTNQISRYIAVIDYGLPFTLHCKFTK
jgi:hypothetical protein